MRSLGTVGNEAIGRGSERLTVLADSDVRLKPQGGVAKVVEFGERNADSMELT